MICFIKMEKKGHNELLMGNYTEFNNEAKRKNLARLNL